MKKTKPKKPAAKKPAAPTLAATEVEAMLWRVLSSWIVEQKAERETLPRKIVQVALNNTQRLAVCDDGTLWHSDIGALSWAQFDISDIVGPPPAKEPNAAESTNAH